MYKTGDKVRVYSLQSFHGGGFINGRLGIVFQDQLPKGSVLVSVERNNKLDKSYEVYPEQLRRISEEEYYKEQSSNTLENTVSEIIRMLKGLVGK